MFVIAFITHVLLILETRKIKPVYHIALLPSFIALSSCSLLH